MTSIHHSDTPALERRRELVANELRLIDAEIASRAAKMPRKPQTPSFLWSAGFRDYDPFGVHKDAPDWIAGRAERDRLAALGVEVEVWC